MKFGLCSILPVDHRLMADTSEPIKKKELAKAGEENGGRFPKDRSA